MTHTVCPCLCRPTGPCGESLAGIEKTMWGQCALCHNGDHWQPGDDDPAFDWPAIFQAAEDFDRKTGRA